MKNKLQSKIDYSIYLVTDRDIMSSFTLEEGVEAPIKGGVTLVQLREKNISSKEFYNIAIKIKKITDYYKIPLIINDRVDLAILIDAAGIHIGQDDLPAREVRKVIGQNKILGVSASNLEESIKAEQDGADYLGVGAMFSTNTKTDAKLTSIEELKVIKEKIRIPIVAIGGINQKTIKDIMNIKVDGLAIVSAILGEKNIEEATKSLKKIFEQSRK